MTTESRKLREPRKRFHAGKKGQYTLEFYDREEGGVLGKAAGPLPFSGVGCVPEVGPAAGASDDEVEQSLLKILEAMGA